MSIIQRVSRREFLKRTGQAGGGLVLAFTVGAGCQQSVDGDPPATAGSGPAPDPDATVAPNVYVNIRGDGMVEIYCHRSEMGQGIRTCLPQVIADELEADWDKIELIQAVGDEKYGDQNTDGSTSIRKQFDLLRRAGASGREMLVLAAAAMWDVPASECVARGHAVHHEASGRSAGYGELVGHAADVEVPEDPAFKSPGDYRYIGKSMDIIDARAMTTGKAIFGFDKTLPDMVFASIERCPVFAGTVKSYDDSKAREISGVVDVIEMPAPTSPPGYNPLGGIAVLATNTWAAEQGRKALEIDWDRGPHQDYSSEKYREELMASARNDGNLIMDRGNVQEAMDAASKTHSADYYVPHLAQAPMEPPAALAVMHDDGSCECWAATQAPQAARGTVAELLGLDKEKVTVHVTLLGGGFGRKSKADFVAEAAWLAQQSGRPVKVTWTREDDIRHGYFHAVSAQHLEGTLDADGNVTGWLHRTAFPTISSTFDASANSPSTGELSLGCVDNPYAIPNFRIETGNAENHVRIGWLRSVANIYHAFAISSFADELAHAAGTDPHAFLKTLIGPDRQVNPADDGAEYENYGQSLEKHPIDTARLKATLDRAAEMANWGRELPDGSGLGIAVHRSFLAYVAAVAEVSRTDDGKIRVDDLWIAIDAGTIVNPDRVRAQMEGCGVFGMSLALMGEITAENGEIVQGNFDRYPVLRIENCPAEIHVDILDVDAPPGGVGEPGVPPIAPAIANAWFAATGERIRDLPFSKAGLV